MVLPSVVVGAGELELLDTPSINGVGRFRAAFG
jgi:hypothetical protein